MKANNRIHILIARWPAFRRRAGLKLRGRTRLAKPAQHRPFQLAGCETKINTFVRNPLASSRSAVAAAAAGVVGLKVR